MSNTKKAILTSISSFVQQFFVVICGIILPRIFIEHYGSTTNGLISSIKQFLNLITFAECGVGAVIQSSFYKPLVEKNKEEINKIFVSSNNFFRKLSIIFYIYVTVVAILFPIISSNSYEYLFVFSLVIIISISTSISYFIGISYRLLLSSDQYGYLINGIATISVILNTFLSVVLINSNCSILIVELVSSIISLLQPTILTVYAKKKYKIDKNIELTEEPIKQKWNGLATHIANIVNSNGDTVILTLFSPLNNISIYSVYHMVIVGIKNIISCFTNGYSSFFGKKYVENKEDELSKTFSFFEWIIHNVVTVLFTLTGVLIIPFIRIYTKNITDANYIVPMFAIIVTIANAISSIRTPYNIMIMAAGHYKQTQNSAFIEAIINITLSLVLVRKYDLAGLAIGTLVAMLYRTLYFIYYLSKNIVYLKLKEEIKQIAADIFIALIIVFISFLLKFNPINYYEWILDAIKIGLIAIVVAIIINIVFYKKSIDSVIRIIKMKFKL